MRPTPGRSTSTASASTTSRPASASPAPHLRLHFQFYHLLPELNTLDNVLMPAYVGHTTAGWWKSRSKWRAGPGTLDRVGLSHRIKHRPRELRRRDAADGRLARSS